MREIEFRGKRMSDCAKSARKWVEGNLEYNHVTKMAFIRTPRHIYVSVEMVDPATVGQYTGLTDKNGVKIFEGDILSFEFEQIGEQKAIVEYSAKAHSFLMRPINDFQFAMMDEGEVVGNIHDNPELLREE